MTGGTTQERRFNPALSPDTFRVDETPLPALLSLCREYAAALVFVPTDGGPSGRWDTLLDKDESFLLARLLAQDFPRVERVFLDDLDASRRPELARTLLDLATWFDAWRDAVGSLSSRSRSARLGSTTRREDFAPDLRAWLSPIVNGSDAASPSATQIRSAYFTLFRAIDAARAVAASEFEASLANKSHDPAASLLIASHLAFQRVQARINRFTGRRLDFYYSDMLGTAARPATPDSVHLVFARDKTFPGDVVVPVGQRFAAGRDPSGAVIEFVAANPLRVTDAQVVALRTLRLERDGSIWPERALGFVTSITTAAYDAEISSGDSAERLCAPLFGGEVFGTIAREAPANIGLALSSPILLLEQGVRQIRLTLRFELPPDADRSTLLRGLKSASSADAFHRALGKLFRAWLLCDRFGLTGFHVRVIRHLNRQGGFIDLKALKPRFEAPPVARDGEAPIRTIDSSADFEMDPLVLLLDHDGALETQKLEQLRIRIRDDLFSSAFMVRATTAIGWLDIDDAGPEETIGAGPDGRPGDGSITLALNLSNEAPALASCSPEIHGPDWPAGPPALSVTLTRNARLFPFSLFEETTLRQVDLSVRVRGLRRLNAYNQLGLLDPGRAFAPFGPLPDTASYLAIGAPEMSGKSVTNLRLNLVWSGLPPSGLTRHYRAYGDHDLTDDGFRARCAVLRDGQWIEIGHEQPLFDVGENGARDERSIDFDASGLSAYWRETPSDGPLDQDARGGYVRLVLSGPDGGFGHQAYPLALADAMRQRVAAKRPGRLPNPPYTPMLARVTLDYEAKTSIRLERASSGNLATRRDSVFHIHPFGVKRIHPSTNADIHRVLPRLEPDGQLMIGLTAADLTDSVTLLFELREDTVTESQARKLTTVQTEWSWLADDRWRPLDRHRVSSDTTRGFQRNGIIILDLPEGPTKDNAVLPGGLFWLRVATDAPSDTFAGLQAVHAQALRATRDLGCAPDGPLPPRTINEKSASIPGVLGIRQPAAGFGLRPAETRPETWTRVSERLRHKARATTPWDYERLVVDAYPSVAIVKCLPNLDPETALTRPGKVVVAVAPTAPRNDPHYSCRAMQLDALELNSIESFLKGRASARADISVRNATFEYVQVRCRIALEPKARFGNVLSTVNRSIIEYISPWSDGGYQAAFQWRLRGDDIEACIRAVPGVQSVGSISLIHVVEGSAGEGFYFRDTAPPKSPTSSREPGAEVSARKPWSLVLPIAQNIIEIIDRDDEGLPAQTGLADPADAGEAVTIRGLQIGATFVIEPSEPQGERVST